MFPVFRRIKKTIILEKLQGIVFYFKIKNDFF